MLENTELILFFVVTGMYITAWILYLLGWNRNSERQIDSASLVLCCGFFLHLCFIFLRFYRAGHIPVLSAFEFVTALACLVTMTFLIFAIKKKNRSLGTFLMPVILCLMAYATLLSKTVEPEIPIFKSLMLKAHVLTVLIGYSSWAVTFAASIFYLYLVKSEQSKSYLMDQMAYKSAFIAFCFLTISIITGALWADQVWGQLWFWDPKETWSFITWLIFLSYLHSRYIHNWEGTRAAFLAIAGFMAVVFTYVGVDFLLPQMHGAGMSTTK